MQRADHGRSSTDRPDAAPDETPHRRRAIVVLAGILALTAADSGAVGAIAPSLEDAFSISHTELGVLAGAFAAVAGIAVIPAGALADRYRRVTLLTAAVLTWSAAMVVGGAAATFMMLLGARTALGALTAVGQPASASITGDLFPGGARGRALGLIESGELVGLAAGSLLVGVVVANLSWRWVFWLLAMAGLVLAAILLRFPEPRRGAGESTDRRTTPTGPGQLVLAAGVAPVASTVLRDADHVTLGAALRYSLRVRTNVLVLVASSLGYFFFAGLKLFAVLFVIEQYGLGRSTAPLLVPVVGAGALAGLVVGGRLGDLGLARGRVNARLHVAIGGSLLAAAALLPALVTTSLFVAIPLMIVGGAGLSAPNPVLDAVRLDIVHPALRGRAESVRILLRTAGEAVAPVAIGAVADHFGRHHHGVQIALLLALPMLLLNAGLLAMATRTYARDVASVAVSVQSSTCAEESAQRGVAMTRAARSANRRPVNGDRRSGVAATAAPGDTPPA